MLIENARVAETKKKLVIKGLKHRPKLPEGFEGGIWEKLSHAVSAVQKAEAVGTSFEELYQAVESMCVHKRAGSLYHKLQDACDSHTKDTVAALSDHLSRGDVPFLIAVDAAWRRHCEQMMLIRAIFMYLDRSYVAVVAEAKARSIFDMGLRQFRVHLEGDTKVMHKTIQACLNLLQQHRAHEVIDTALLRSMLRMLRDLGVYMTRFHDPCLAGADAAYTAQGQELAGGDLPVAAALAQAEMRLQEEEARAREFLDTATLEPMLAVVKRRLLEEHLRAFIARGLGDLLEQRRHEDLARMYRLARLVHRGPDLRSAFHGWILATGSALVIDQEKDAALIETLLKLKIALHEMLDGPFRQDASFADAVREAFEKFMNMRENKPGELLAKYLDGKLRTGTRKGGTEAGFEAELDQALFLFRYLQAKDVFEAFYKKDFAKRLLMDKSSSIDMEKSMIAKLKAECGAQYTSKLEGMFKDEHLSKDIAAAFKASEEYAQLPRAMDANMRVLTAGFWPSYPVVDMKLPEDIKKGREVFESYYLRHHSGRKLTWHSGMEQCTLKAVFPACGERELVVSMHQAAVLLLFVRADSLSFDQIVDLTALPVPELKRTLQSLALGKTRVLRKEPKGKEVDDTDSFHWRGDFTTALFRVRINQIQSKETVEENKRTNDQVLQDRQYQIDAALVRVMKSRKHLSHKLLVQEVMQQLKFTIKASDLKKRIESLIEREYLARAEGHQDMYNYLA
eukprot:jgi/Ulvmu1/3829/UM018_0041.1